ncbi:MAG: F0F1 ATP synthase subunit epsilon [bacterium]
MKVVIAKVDQVYFDGEAVSVTVPATEGEMTVLGNHEPFVTTLKPGVITVHAADLQDGQQFFEVTSGVLEIHPGGATIIL